MKRDVGRERGRGKKIIRQLALRSPFVPLAPRTDSDRLTDSAERSERAGARARRRTKGSSAGGGPA